MGIEKCGLKLNRMQRELQPHGTFAFPCAGYSGWYASQTEQVIPWHWHEEIEIGSVKNGTLLLKTPAKTYPLERGDCFIINSNILHFATATPTCELQSLVFHPNLIVGDRESVFATKYLFPLLANPSFDGYPLKRDREPRQIQQFQSAFEALANDTPGFEFVVRENLSKICFFLYQQFQAEIEVGGQGLPADAIRMHKMLDYLHHHYPDDIRLRDIAKAADIGERECLRCFQRTIQISPMQYLLKYKVMQGANILLKYPSKSISEVATLCGFDSPSNFSKMFKRFYNSTPRDYRKSTPHSSGALI